MEHLGFIGHQDIGVVARSLDLGCGKGGDVKYLKSLGYQVTAVDKELHYDQAIVSDICDFQIEPGSYAVIICNNVLPFIQKKSEVEKIVSNIFQGLIDGGVAFITFYGPHSCFNDRLDMSFYEYEEILSFIELFHIEIMDKTTTEGYTKNGKGEVIYQHSHRFMVRK